MSQPNQQTDKFKCDHMILQWLMETELLQINNGSARFVKKN